MVASDEVAVTLSEPLYKVLLAEAARLEVSLEWLVASLVADSVACDQNLLAAS